MALFRVVLDPDSGRFWDDSPHFYTERCLESQWPPDGSTAPSHHLPHLHTLIPVLPVTPKWRKICRWGLRATPGIWPMSCGSGPSRSHVNPVEPESLSSNASVLASRTKSQSFRCSRNCGKTVHMTPQDVQGAPKRSQGPRDASRRLHEAPRRFLDASRDPPGLPGRNRDFPWEHTHF